MDMMHVDLHFAPLGLALLLSTGACALRIFYALRPFAAAEKKLPERGAYLAIRGNWFLAAQAISFSAAGGVRLKPPVISGVGLSLQPLPYPQAVVVERGRFDHLYTLISTIIKIAL
jgi:hypothetical protein